MKLKLKQKLLFIFLLTLLGCSNLLISPELNYNFSLSKNILVSNNLNSYLDNKGNGIVIFKNSYLKINNYKPDSDKKAINYDFDSSNLKINENGNGLLSMYKNTTSFTNNSYSDNQIQNKYKKIKHYEISNETFSDEIIVPDNDDINGNGFITKQEINDKGKKVLRKYKVDNYKINNQYTDLFELNNGESLRIDKKGNGILIKNTQQINSFKIVVVKNYNLEKSEFNLSIQKQPTLPHASGFITRIDEQGNGYITWIHNTFNSEMVLKKIINYLPSGEEVSLGDNYKNPNIYLNNDGTGFITWLMDSVPSSIGIRKINGYNPESNYYSLTSGRIHEIYNLNILNNNNGNGLIIWQENNGNAHGFGNFYYRKFENYNVSTQGLKEFSPLVAMSVPPYIPTPFPVITPSYIVGKNGEHIEVNNIRGYIYDKYKNPVQDADINIIILYTNEIKKDITTGDGRFVINNVPLGEIEIQVSKQGYKTISRKVKVLPASLNQFNFGSNNPEDEQYTFEKEEER